METKLKSPKRSGFSRGTMFKKRKLKPLFFVNRPLLIVCSETQYRPIQYMQIRQFM